MSVRYSLGRTASLSRSPIESHTVPCPLGTVASESVVMAPHNPLLGVSPHTKLITLKGSINLLPNYHTAPQDGELRIAQETR